MIPKNNKFTYASSSVFKQTTDSWESWQPELLWGNYYHPIAQNIATNWNRTNWLRTCYKPTAVTSTKLKEKHADWSTSNTRLICLWMHTVLIRTLQRISECSTNMLRLKNITSIGILRKYNTLILERIFDKAKNKFHLSWFCNTFFWH